MLSYEVICRKIGFDLMAEKSIDDVLSKEDILQRIKALSDEEKAFMLQYLDEHYYSFKDIPNDITLDFSGCSNWFDIHSLLKEKFGLPEYYGKNWSALWDCLDGLFSDRGDCNIIIKGYNELDEELKKACKPMLEIFEEIENEEENVKFVFET